MTESAPRELLIVSRVHWDAVRDPVLIEAHLDAEAVIPQILVGTLNRVELEAIVPAEPSTNSDVSQ